MKCVLLGNGPSLARHDLSQIAYPKFGMNRSWMLEPDPAYHVGLEPVHYHANPDYFERLGKLGRLYVVGGGWPCGKLLAFASGIKFSTRLEDGIVTELHGIGSIFYASLQIAYALGFREVLALGLDLDGPHFDGSPASANVEAQNKLFAHVPADLKVKVCGSPESRAVFPKVDFEEACS